MEEEEGLSRSPRAGLAAWPSAAAPRCPRPGSADSLWAAATTAQVGCGGRAAQAGTLVAAAALEVPVPAHPRTGLLPLNAQGKLKPMLEAAGAL